MIYSVGDSAAWRIHSDIIGRSVDRSPHRRSEVFAICRVSVVGTQKECFVNPNETLKNIDTVLVIDWPTKDVPESLALDKFHVVVPGQRTTQSMKAL